MVDRIERHDILNAVLLAAVLLLLAFGIVTGLESLSSTVDEGLVVSTKTEEPTLESEVLTATTIQGEDTTPTSEIVQARPANEVTVRVGNGAGRQGVAGAGTDALEAAGYPALPPKNGPATDESIVYFLEGYAADATKVAQLLGLQPGVVEAMPEDPGIPVDDAHLIIILGADSDF